MNKSDLSLPLLGAWIEMTRLCGAGAYSHASLPLLGAWIEISRTKYTTARARRRSLCWERGLKYQVGAVQARTRYVAPFAGSVD